MASTISLELSDVPSTLRQNTPSALTTTTRRRAQSEEMTTPQTSRTIEFTTLRRERGRSRAAARQLQADERRTPSSTPIPVSRPTSFGQATVTYRVVKMRHTAQQLSRAVHTSTLLAAIQRLEPRAERQDNNLETIGRQVANFQRKLH